MKKLWVCFLLVNFLFIFTLTIAMASPATISTDSSFILQAADIMLKKGNNNNYYRVPMKSIKSMLDSNTPVTIVDIRSEKGFNSGHIPGSFHLPLPELTAKLIANPQFLPLTRPVYVICCPKDSNAAYAVSVLRMANYEAYAIVSGGIPAWQDAGYPIVEGPFSDHPIIYGQNQFFVSYPDLDVLSASDDFLRSIPGSRGFVSILEDVKKRLEENRPVLLLDVRSEENFAVEHIQNSMNVPLPVLAEFLMNQSNLIPPDHTIYVISNQSFEAAFAITVLRIAGYNAFVLSDKDLSFSMTMK